MGDEERQIGAGASCPLRSGDCRGLQPGRDPNRLSLIRRALPGVGRRNGPVPEHTHPPGQPARQLCAFLTKQQVPSGGHAGQQAVAYGHRGLQAQEVLP
eukprot:scaffold629471_cov34-Prasinocladus_malaysianus.AAC.1